MRSLLRCRPPMLRASSISAPLLLALLLLATPAQAQDVAYADYDGQFLAGFITATAGAGMLVTFGIAASRIDELENDNGFRRYREGFKTFESACERAEAGKASAIVGATSPLRVRDVCNEAETLEIVSAVALPVGIIALVTGAYLMLSSDTVLAPSENGAVVAGRF